MDCPKFEFAWVSNECYDKARNEMLRYSDALILKEWLMSVVVDCHIEDLHALYDVIIKWKQERE